MPKGIKGFQKGHSQFNTGRTHWKKGHIPWIKGKKHSLETFKKMKIFMFKKGHPKPKNAYKWGKRNKNFNWNGGKKIMDGYIYILKPNHPFCIKQGYVLKSRLVMEKYLKRYLKPTEVVHHINKNRLDNRIKNLMLFKNKSEHRKHHCHQ